MDNFLDMFKQRLLLENTAYLSPEVLETIVDLTNIGQITILLIVLQRLELINISKDDMQQILHKRMDPIRYLSKFINNPLALLTLMRNTGVVLSGSRALEYFVPGSCTSGSDWDFYSYASSATVIMFIGWSTLLGIQWDPTNFEQSARHNAEGTINIYNTNLLCGQIKSKDTTHKVQLVFGRGLTASHQITKFHCTAVQCSISGFAAVSLYHQLTMNKICVGWINNVLHKHGEEPIDDELLEERRDKYAALKDKYVSRGFKYINYTEYIRNSRILEVGNIGGRNRYISDGETCLISFRRYINSKKWNNTFYQYICRLPYIQWYDFDYGTVPNMSLVDAVKSANIHTEFVISSVINSVLARITMPLRDQTGRIRPYSAAAISYQAEQNRRHQEFKESCVAFVNILRHEQPDANFGELTEAKYAILVNIWSRYQRNYSLESAKGILLPY